MTAQKTNAAFLQETMQNFKTNKTLRVVTSIAIIALAIAIYLIATASNVEAVSAAGATLHTQFDTMWDEVKGLMTGSPAKVLMGLGICGVLMFSVVKPNLIGFAASVVTLLVMANAAGTIDTSMTITVEALKAMQVNQ
jgi:hypothetical protein